jgi:hypothetical protein
MSTWLQEEDKEKIGKVFIASMNMRGKWAEPIEDGIKINVTSAQGKTNKNRLAFSPMTPIEGGYKGYWNFESYWQSGKVFENIPAEKTKKYWKELKEPKRRYPNSKGKNVLYSLFNGEKMDYITARKKVYIPEYYKLIKNNDVLLYWKNMLKKGNNLIIYDFDGPRNLNGEVMCLELTEELLKEKINNPRFPFGHGYIVGATILGIKPKKYV